MHKHINMHVNMMFHEAQTLRASKKTLKSQLQYNNTYNEKVL